uniref:H1.6 linker histone, cluster member n=2 Tax=Canis lupus familiaris TaxID=9615 RepID=A0A8P0SFQ2_CANLF
MSETVPAVAAGTALASMENPSAKKRGRKPGGIPEAAPKAPGLSVSKLIMEALSVSQERAGMSLAALKKALAAAGYDVEKNNSRIKLCLKSLVSKGTLVQTKGTGASGSFKLNKKALLPTPAKSRVKRPPSTKTKRLVLSRDSKSPKAAKTNKAKKPGGAGAQKAACSGRKAKGAKDKQPRKSPGKAPTGKPKAAKPRLNQQKVNPRKAVSKKHLLGDSCFYKSGREPGNRKISLDIPPLDPLPGLPGLPDLPAIPNKLPFPPQLMPFQNFSGFRDENKRFVELGLNCRAGLILD